ncbi:hypothetical protein [Cupriavidus basilensis]|uniref:hypothetical protein n=1 Tax=Cupriavidus basilensis TaxID=68895 RepID=UPI0020A65B95|nr:hypothetical protein [Cupriavidus basilensis]MCP3024722.1 hypothetical protein [Cupriavidus basilensis]
MSSTSLIKVEPSAAHRDLALKDLTIAWALDASTSRAIHILELGPERSGKLSACVCPSCGADLVAVNNAKLAYKRRPHFRHVAGASAERGGLAGCAIVAARYAMLRAMEDRGWIELPMRQRSKTVSGYLDQSFSEVATRQSERVFLRQARLVDRTRAVLTLADGRRVDVVLAGEADLSAQDDDVSAVITIEVSDPSLAEMGADELRDRLSLPGVLCWQQHWQDATLDEEARINALAAAVDHLALAPADLVLPEDMPPELKTETVLHYAVKQILAEEGAFLAPGAHLEARAQSVGKEHIATWKLEPTLLELKEVQLERRLQLIRPDLTCVALDSDGTVAFPSLCIEVTVTHGIDAERLGRIRQVNLPTVEINLRDLGGRITRSLLHDLVRHGQAVKSWVHHPEFNGIQSRLQLEANVAMEAEAAEIAAEWARVERVRGTPVPELSERYLSAARGYFEYLQGNRGPFLKSDPRLEEFMRVKLPVLDAAADLRLKGVYGGDNEELLDENGILACLLSLRTDSALTRGAEPGGGFAVLQQVIDSPEGVRSSILPLLFGAAKLFRISLTDEQIQLLKQWRAEVKERFKGSLSAYVRNEQWDRFLSQVMPELEDLIRRTSSMHRFLEARQGMAAEPTAGNLEAPRYDWMYRGARLQQWVNENPEAAEKFFGLKPNR